MRYWTRPLVMLALVGGLVVYGLRAQVPPATPDKPPAPGDSKIDKSPASTPKAATHKVEKGPFKIEVTLKGVFEAEQMTEVALRPEAWHPQQGGMLMLRKAIEHGTAVKQGEPVLWLDTEKLDHTIRDMDKDQQLALLAIKQAEEELPLLEKAAPQDLAAAERAKRIADEDLKRFVEIDREFTVQAANQMLKSYRQYLDYAKEELKQLEKMYRSKDLTEETEEIILRRQRNQVEAMSFYLKMAEKELEETVKIDLPRRDQSMHDNAVRTGLLLEKARTSIPTTISQKRLALAKMKYDREKADERLAKLKRDREALTVKAPADGVVYHGKCVRGQWQSGGDRLRAGAMIQPDEVLLTVVQAVKTLPYFVRTEIEEKDLQHLQAGQKGKASPTIAPDSRMPVTIDRISPVPISAGKFDARLTLDGWLVTTNPIVPGMACSVKFVPYVKEQAISVPATAVFTDDLDDEKQYVYLVDKDGKHTKKTVRVGKKADRKVEILEGLQEGDQILTEKPGEPKKPEIPAKKPEAPAKEVKP